MNAPPGVSRGMEGITALSGCPKSCSTSDNKHIHQETTEHSGRVDDHTTNPRFVLADRGTYRRGMTTVEMVEPGSPIRAGG